RSFSACAPAQRCRSSCWRQIPESIVDRLFREIHKAMQHPDVKKRQNAVGIEPGGSASPQDFVKFIREDTARWARIIRDASIKVE
ncbi:MAG: hypothetical protein ACT4P8_14825, partial [Betaproteobacteria bacterium]